MLVFCFFGGVLNIYLLAEVIKELAISYLIIYLTVLIVRVDSNNLSIFIASVIGAAYLLCVERIIRAELTIFIIIVLIIGILLVLKANIVKILIVSIVYMLVCLVLVGSVSMVSKFIGSEQYAVVGIAITILAIRIVVHILLKNRHSNTYIYRIIAKNGDKIIECKGYYDSGNKLLDSEGQAMIVISRKLQQKLSLNVCGITRVATVGGVQELPKVKISFRIYFTASRNRIYHTHAVVSETFAGDEYDIILHRDMGEHND